MEADLKTLEASVQQLVELCSRLRAENVRLRQELAQSQDDVRQLQENMTRAGERLQALIASLPEENVDE